MEFEELRAKVMTQDLAKMDYVAPVADVRYDGGHALSFAEPLAGKTPGFSGLYQAEMTDWAFGQWCEKLGIPARYMDKCPEWLQKQNAEHWLEQHANGQWLVRTDAGKIRAVLSESYMPIDNRDVIAELGGVDMSGLNIRRLFTSDQKMVVRTTLRDVAVEIDGKPVFGGLDIYNSEVGAHALSVGLSFFQMICSNGLIRRYGGGEFFRRVHRGGEWSLSNGFDGILNEATDMARVILEVIRHSAEVSMPLDEMIEAALKLGLRKTMVDELREKTDTTLSGDARVYDFVSAITRKAQDLALDSRNDMEELGMRLTEHLAA